MLQNNSREIKQAKRIISQSKAKSIVPVDLDNSMDPEYIGIPSYSETQQLLDKFENIRQKYMPDADTYAKKTLNQRIHFYMTNDRFMEQERIEVRKKYNYYKMRIQMPFFELISIAQYRLSLYNIFNITDQMEINTLKTKKVRNQLKLVKIRLDDNQKQDHETMSKIEKLQAEIEQLKKQNAQNSLSRNRSGLMFESKESEEHNRSKLIKNKPNVFSMSGAKINPTHPYVNKNNVTSRSSIEDMTAGLRALIQ